MIQTPLIQITGVVQRHNQNVARLVAESDDWTMLQLRNLKTAKI
jgi:hypothetical protein